MDEDYLNDREMARLLGITVQGLRNKVSQGDRLPPRVTLPGMRIRLWPRRELEKWMQQYLRTSPSALPGVYPVESRGRGRPRKVITRGEA